MRNEGITDRPVRPWQLPGAVRRDCEPHRGPLVRRVGHAAFVLSLLLAVTPLVLLPGVPLMGAGEFPEWGVPLFPLAGVLPSLAAWALARHDLALMRQGLMDPAGELAVWTGGGAGVPGWCWPPCPSSSAAPSSWSSVCPDPGRHGRGAG
jgi:hypothetical protein